MQEKLSRFAILSLVIVAMAICAHTANAQTYYPKTSDTLFLDASGNVVGERIVYCNGSIDQWGQQTQNRDIISHGGCTPIYQTATGSDPAAKCVIYLVYTWSDYTQSWYCNGVGAP
jgi:hypothetical protein